LESSTQIYVEEAAFKSTFPRSLTMPFTWSGVTESVLILSMRVFNSFKKGNSVNNKPWFNGECKVKRDEFHNARKNYASSKTPENKTLLNTRANEYRLVLNANYKKYTGVTESVLILSMRVFNSFNTTLVLSLQEYEIN
jgi:hypothetical protein